MSENATTTNQWLVFTLADQKYAIHVDCVRELTRSSDHEICPLPQTPDDIVGALSLRGNIIAIRDLRTLIRLPSLESETREIVELLETCEQDHVNWINELRASVHENREFKLARDPHRCAFGRWYDALLADEVGLQKLTNSNFTLYRLLGQLGMPHKIIHSVADKVTECVQEKNFDRAHEIIDATSDNELATMISLLGQIRKLLFDLRKPLIVVVEWNDRQMGIQVDSVDSVVRIPSEQIDPLSNQVGGSNIFNSMARVGDDTGLLMILDAPKLFEDGGSEFGLTKDAPQHLSTNKPALAAAACS